MGFDVMEEEWSQDLKRFLSKSFKEFWISDALCQKCKKIRKSTFVHKESEREREWVREKEDNRLTI